MKGEKMMEEKQWSGWRTFDNKTRWYSFWVLSFASALHNEGQFVSDLLQKARENTKSFCRLIYFKTKWSDNKLGRVLCLAQGLTLPETMHSLLIIPTSLPTTSTFKNLSFPAAQWSSFPFARWDAVWFMSCSSKPVWSLNHSVGFVLFNSTEDLLFRPHPMCL